MKKYLFISIAFLFSFWLMFHTFSYDGQKQEIQIASKLWSDFGAHIPLIRSFSHGPNLSRLNSGQPIESPLFPGEPIRYHFGFYALVGILEKLGMRIDWALNIPSAIGFFLLLTFIYKLSYSLFKNYWVAILSVLFFLCNGSLSFIKFFETYAISDIITNSKFISFGPWDGSNISAFWTLNIYTNQRHLALSYAIILIILLFRKNHILTAALLNILVFINYAAAAIAGLFLLFLSPVSLLFAIPSVLIIRHIANPVSGITWQPGYLSHGNFFNFWWQNIGLHLFLIPLGVLLAPKPVRTALLSPLLVLFILPNLFRFSPDMINNHKFFNFFIILGGMFSAYAIFRIGRIRRIGPISLICLIFFSTLSGIVDFFPVLNDHKGGISDSAANPDSTFFARLPTDAIVANSTWFYHPASLAGRSLLSGYTYFTWSYGYNQAKREQELIAVYRAGSIDQLCRLLKLHTISYIELSQSPEAYLHPNRELWNSLTPMYTNPKTGLRVYATPQLCTAPIQ